MEARQVHPRLRHQGRRTHQKIRWLEDHVRRAVPARRLAPRQQMEVSMASADLEFKSSKKMTEFAQPVGDAAYRRVVPEGTMIPMRYFRLGKTSLGAILRSYACVVLEKDIDSERRFVGLANSHA